jgi:hypothetical protein
MESKLASERHLPHGGLPPDRVAETVSPRDIESCFPRAKDRAMHRLIEGQIVRGEE